ncbi:hypothetical protein T03_6699, partial [Trichinella britovi]
LHKKPLGYARCNLSWKRRAASLHSYATTVEPLASAPVNRG